MLVQQMSHRLHQQTSFEDAIRVILNDAIGLHGAEFGSVQLNAGDHLVIAAQRGFKPAYLELFQKVTASDGCACGRALRTRRTVVVTDTEADEQFAPYRAAARALGFRSVMTTPLLTEQGLLVGAVSTHFVNVHKPTAIEMETLKSYSRLAADHLYGVLDGDSIASKARSMSRRLSDEVT